VPAIRRLSLVLYFIVSFGTLAVADLPNKPRGYVTDEAHILDAATINQIEQLSVELEEKTSAELGVVTISSLEGRDIEGYASDLFQKWGLGKKGKDNGVLLLIAPNDRRGRLEVGYGLEGLIPDGLAGRILDEAVIPFFRQGNMAGGVLSGAMQTAQIIAQGHNVQLTRIPNGYKRQLNQRKSRSPLSLGLGFLLFLIMLILFVRHPLLFWLLLSGRGGGGGWGGGGFGGGGFGGFGGGMSGGGGSSRGW
jgi:uncharacterized protein